MDIKCATCSKYKPDVTCPELSKPIRKCWEPRLETFSMGAKVNPNICSICGGSDCVHLRYSGFGTPVPLERPVNLSVLRAKGFRVFIDGELTSGIEHLEISNNGTVLAAVVQIYNPIEESDKVKTLVTDARINTLGSLDLHLITFSEDF